MNPEDPTETPDMDTVTVTVTLTREPKVGATLYVRERGWVVVETIRQTEAHHEDKGTDDLWTVTARLATPEEARAATEGGPSKVRPLQGDLRLLFGRDGALVDWPAGAEEVLKYNQFDKIEARILGDQLVLCGLGDGDDARSLPRTPDLETQVRAAFTPRAKR